MLLLWCSSMIQVFSYPLGERSFHLVVDLKQAIVFVSGRISPQVLRCLHNPRRSYPFFVYFSTTPFFSLHSFISTGGIVILLSSTHLLVLSRSSSFLAYPFNRSVVFSFELSHLLKFCLLPQPECGLKSFLPLVPFFQ